MPGIHNFAGEWLYTFGGLSSPDGAVHQFLNGDPDRWALIIMMGPTQLSIMPGQAPQVFGSFKSMVLPLQNVTVFNYKDWGPILALPWFYQATAAMAPFAWFDVRIVR